MIYEYEHRRKTPCFDWDFIILEFVFPFQCLGYDCLNEVGGDPFLV